jgi:uncharacterized protein (DUF362 family)
MTRRQILTGAAGAAAAASLGGLAGCFPDVGGQWPDGGPDAETVACGCSPPDGGSTPDEEPSPVPETSVVATIQRDDSIDGKGLSLDPPQLEAVESMVNAVLSTLAGGASNPWSVILPGAGWCTRIGLKVNCLNAKLPTSPAVVRAVVKSLVERGGVCPGNIIIWDRGRDELVNTGKYTEAHLQHARLLGTVGTDGPGYSNASFGAVRGATPRLSNILLQETDVTINLPVLKTHGQSGVTASLKNIYGIIDIPEEYHNPILQTALPELFALPPIRKSIKLTIVDALRAVINGDTDSAPDARPHPGRIFGSLDPVAVDCYARDLVNELRAAQKLGSPVDESLLQWIEYAHAMGLGTKNYTLVTPSAAGDGLDGGTLDGAAALDMATG